MTAERAFALEKLKAITGRSSMEQIAWALMSISALMLLGYSVYYSFDELFKESGIPTPVKVAIPVVLPGAIILLLVSLRDRVAARRKEDFRKDEL